MSHRLREPRIGLVLCAGGVLGGAWLAGALAALSRETGWDPGDADYIVGTSAGSLFAALLAARVPPRRLLPASSDALTPGMSDDWLLMDLAMESAYELPVQFAFPRPTWPTRWRPPAPSRAISSRCRSATAAMSTGASTRCRTRPCWQRRASTWRSC